MKQIEKAECFAAFHVNGSPLVVHNAWDAGSAKAIRDAGAAAIATSSWAVAAAHGYEDGEAIPIELVEQIIGRIATTVDIPLTVDFEGGYSEGDDVLAANVSRLVDAFDLWMARSFPAIPFERYADDIICHCRSEEEARTLWSALEVRFRACRLVLHPAKTKLVYCKEYEPAR
jgi:hypothetical protein